MTGEWGDTGTHWASLVTPLYHCQCKCMLLWHWQNDWTLFYNVDSKLSIFLSEAALSDRPLLASCPVAVWPTLASLGAKCLDSTWHREACSWLLILLDDLFLNDERLIPYSKFWICRKWIPVVREPEKSCSQTATPLFILSLAARQMYWLQFGGYKKG